MIKSMTGYGSFEEENDFCLQSWEIKSVNGKQLGLRWRLPGFLKAQEVAWEKQVRQWVLRGRIEIDLRLQFTDLELSPMSFNQHLAESMLNQLEETARLKNRPFQADLNRFLSVPGLWQESNLPGDDRLQRTLEQGLAQVLQNWDRSRSIEGQALKDDLKTRVSRLKQWIQELETLTQDAARKKFELLKERVTILLDDQSLDEARLYQELALIADKIDVSEELIRLKTHIQTLAQKLDTEKTGGRELDFLLQECFREINTCGNKAQDAEISQLVVSCKNELERCREQVQNLE